MPEPVTNKNVSSTDINEEATGGVQNKITWTDSISADVKSYQIHRSTTSNPLDGKQLDGYIEPNTETYTDTTANAGTTYYYHVGASDGTNINLGTAIQVDTTKDIDSAPTTISGITANDADTSGNGTFVNVNFTNSTESDFASYEVYIVASTFTGTTYNEVTNAAVNSVTSTSIEDGTNGLQVDAGANTGEFKVYVFSKDTAGQVSGMPTAANVTMGQ
ncbi:hypothetical protein [Tenuibacillus multivorans]|uniref:Fibronectin type-III domain-containing protein n=1 Tax=Tenuibacillus multivorans TaxID=237069 RepID=A0A1H0BMC4_9BACI|nr:hypothetical protein [Tenuibacillus multivorans]GEL77109.1 hypothetical protein TMU01_13440 [Tenuibacillus multivorans]SDN46816.1 hypothetical protein SAMN05216498_2311 [Tenuibacillus multivorans]